MQEQSPSSAIELEKLAALDERAARLEAATKQINTKRGGVKPVRVVLWLGCGVVAGFVGHELLGRFGAVLGILAGLVGGIVLLERVFGSGVATSRPGTRAWEAMHLARLLNETIYQRRLERADAFGDDEKRARLAREIAWLTAQLEECDATVAANDGRPGRGAIGFVPRA